MGGNIEPACIPADIVKSSQSGIKETRTKAMVVVEGNFTRHVKQNAPQRISIQFTVYVIALSIEHGNAEKVYHKCTGFYNVIINLVVSL